MFNSTLTERGLRNPAITQTIDDPERPASRGERPTIRISRPGLGVKCLIWTALWNLVRGTGDLHAVVAHFQSCHPHSSRLESGSVKECGNETRLGGTLPFSFFFLFFWGVAFLTPVLGDITWSAPPSSSSPRCPLAQPFDRPCKKF